MDEKELESAVEGILFASGEPLHVERICFALSIERADAERILRRLQDYYAFERRGMRLLQMEDRWQLCSSPDHADAIRKAFEIRKPAKLSQPALEALTIIAYYQPTTRAYVDKLRGVDSAYTVGLLLERGLIETCGNLQAPGRPLLYRTTEKFLRSFHISSLDELPPLNEDDIPPQQLKIEDIAKADAPQPESVPETGAVDEPESVPEPESVDEPQAVAETEGVDEPESVPELGSVDEPEAVTETKPPPRELMMVSYPRLLAANPVPVQRKPARTPYRMAGAFRTRRTRPTRKRHKSRRIARPCHAPPEVSETRPPEVPDASPEVPDAHDTRLIEASDARHPEVSPGALARPPRAKTVRRCLHCLLCGCWLSWPFC
ncbi:MAG: SMC-Scp complex subunit ScpB [Oscillibacter sp.]|nr:SMC-Scp complex subunit ScpB [Oscillibacter sp.]